jgi:uncharacterized protein (TIGR03790 family)
MGRILASAFLPLALLAGGAVRPALAAADAAASRVVLLANRDDPDSAPLARHYAELRGVPFANILAFSMPLQETISWSEFIATVWQPLQDELVRRRWIDGAATGAIDGIGRRIYAISGHRIAALVVCRGVPLRIDNDPVRYAAGPTATVPAEFSTNAGAVDSELSLLAMSGGYPINGYVANPLFGRDHPTDLERSRVVEVARLDGPTPADARLLVDQAIAAERSGLLGRAYVVMGGAGADGNRWLERTAAQILAMGFDTSIQRQPGGLATSARCDAPALYFGWHDPEITGPFALPGFRFPPGAIALHIHSYSASTLRSASECWCGPLVARGVTATMGNVFEPYLQFTHRPDLLYRALARGDRLVDAAYYALPALSWQCVLVGDPLYRPFSVPLREQLRDLDSLPRELAGYPVLRLMHLLESEGRADDAISVARAALNEQPSIFVLRVALAQRLQDQGKPEEAASVLAPAANIAAFAPDQWALARDAAQLFAALRQPGNAVEVYRHLLGLDALPVELRAKWLVEAAQAAVSANDSKQAAAWQKDLEDLTIQMQQGHE